MRMTRSRRRKSRRSKSQKRSYRRNPKARKRTRVKSYLRKRRAKRTSRRRNPRRISRTRKVSRRRYRGSRRRKNPFFGLFKKKSRRTKTGSRRRYKGRRRRNPSLMQTARGAFSGARLTRGAGIVFGLGAGAFAKQIVLKVAPAGAEWASRAYGLLAIFAGAMLNMQSREPAVKAMGTGVLSYGILDVLVSNVKPLAEFLPQIAGPSFSFAANPGTGTAEITEGGMKYGRSTYGAELSSRRAPEVVGAANLQRGVYPEIVGGYDDDYDGLDNMI